VVCACGVCVGRVYGVCVERVCVCVRVVCVWLPRTNQHTVRPRASGLPHIGRLHSSPPSVCLCVCLCVHRPYWRCYYANTDAIIYVVDSTDRDRLAVSKEELVAMLEVRRKRHPPLCEHAQTQTQGPWA
jgi:hypothetical protein